MFTCPLKQFIIFIDNFEKWLKNDSFPKLKDVSLNILDNATYHSHQLNKAPTTSLDKKIGDNMV